MDAPTPPRKARAPRGLRAVDEPPPLLRDEDAPDEPEPEPEPWYHALPGLQFLEDIEPLTRTEARNARERVAKSIRNWGKLLDEAMPLLSRTHADVNIWGNLDEHESQVLADWLIDLGKTRAVAAQVVRGLVRTYFLWEVGAITGPRFIASVHYYLRNGFVVSLGIRPQQSVAQALAHVA